VTNFFDGTVTRIDPKTNQIASVIRIGNTPQAVAVGPDAVWVTVTGSCSRTFSGGHGKPQFVIASDLPLQGAARTSTLPMTEAIRFVLRGRHFRAGKYRIGYLSCDDATAQAGGFDYARCRANAKAYDDDARVIGVIGAFNSGCTGAELPIANRAAHGPLAMISPMNTSTWLTRAGPGTQKGELRFLYPTGQRNFVRIIAADDTQGAADALLARKLGAKRVFVLDDGDRYGIGIASYFERAARRLGMRVVGRSTWSAKTSGYRALANRIRASQAQVVFLGGFLYAADGHPTGGRLIAALRRAMGERVKLIAPDGFLPIRDVVDSASASAKGLFVSFPGAPNEWLGPRGQEFLDAFGATEPGHAVVSYAAAYAAQAADLLLDAIARSDGTRASVTKALLRSRVRGGILASFSFDVNGDTTTAPVTIFRISPGARTNSTLLADFAGATIDRVIVPRHELVK
jgi:branched-chain amino acid transport system substrate-binding protein